MGEKTREGEGGGGQTNCSPLAKASILPSTIGLVEQLSFAGPAELLQIPQSPDLIWKSFYQAGVTTEHAEILHKLCTTFAI